MTSSYFKGVADREMYPGFILSYWFVGFDSPRLDSVGNPLPNERLLSLAIFQQPMPEADPVVTLASMVFGQFVAHDIGKMALTQHPGRKLCHWDRKFQSLVKTIISADK